jgi:hypothetical protein
MCLSSNLIDQWICGSAGTKMRRLMLQLAADSTATYVLFAFDNGWSELSDEAAAYWRVGCRLSQHHARWLKTLKVAERPLNPVLPAP